MNVGGRMSVNECRWTNVGGRMSFFWSSAAVWVSNVFSQVLHSSEGTSCPLPSLS